MKAYCFASGLIEFGSKVPEGALPIASGREKALRKFIAPVARHGYSTRLVNGRQQKIPGTETLLVPGVPEARDENVAYAALRAWTIWIRKAAPEGIIVLVGGA